MMDSKKTVSFFAAFGAVIIGMVVMFIIISFRDYGGFTYFDYSAVVQSVIAKTFGTIVVIPTIHVMIASIWKSKRNSNSRRKTYIGWTIVIVVSQLVALSAG